MKILNLSLGQDTGGQQGRMARAFRRLAPTWQYETVTSSSTFYPIERRYHPQLIRSKLWPWADVVHVHNSVAHVAGRFERHSHRRKPYVVHYHGSQYRIGAETLNRDAARYGAVPIVSTLDLQAIAPDVTTWLPTPYNLDELASYRGAKRDDGVLRVSHAPTNRAVKSTDALIAAVERLKSEGAAVELDIIENVNNAECIRRKGLTDVYVDQVLLGYGCNAIEAWGLGLPVIAGVDPELCLPRMRQRIPATTRDLMLETWGTLPFYEATESSLYDALVAMMDAKTRKAYADRGMAHIRRWHDEPVVVPMLQAIYRQALT